MKNKIATRIFSIISIVVGLALIAFGIVTISESDTYVSNPAFNGDFQTYALDAYYTINDTISAIGKGFGVAMIAAGLITIAVFGLKFTATFTPRRKQPAFQSPYMQNATPTPSPYMPQAPQATQQSASFAPAQQSFASPSFYPPAAPSYVPQPQQPVSRPVPPPTPQPTPATRVDIAPPISGAHDDLPEL